MPSNNTSFPSPTGSEFSDSMDDPDSAKNWDVDRVVEWLCSVGSGHLEKNFRSNNINGENLLEMDKEVLKDLGIIKVGERVRLFVDIKRLRTRAYANVKKRNKVCCCLCLTHGSRTDLLGLFCYS